MGQASFVQPSPLSRRLQAHAKTKHGADLGAGTEDEAYLPISADMTDSQYELIHLYIIHMYVYIYIYIYYIQIIIDIDIDIDISIGIGIGIVIDIDYYTLHSRVH